MIRSHFKDILKSKSGASSILVIIMMLVLLILGLAIATTSISNRKLSEKKTKWLVSYYDLNGEAQIRISEIANAIDKSKKKSKNSKQYKEKLELELKDLDVKAAMPYDVNDMSSCNISFEIREENSEFNKRLFANLMVPLNPKNKGANYQLINYQLIQEPLVSEEIDEFKENPFEHMNE